MTSNVTNVLKPIPLVLAKETSLETVSAIQAFVAEKLEALPLSTEGKLEGDRFQTLEDLSLEIFEMILVNLQDKKLMEFALVCKDWNFCALKATQRKIFLYVKVQLGTFYQEQKSAGPHSDEKAEMALTLANIRQEALDFICAFDISKVSETDLMDLRANLGDNFQKGLLNLLILEKLCAVVLDHLSVGSNPTETVKLIKAHFIELLEMNEISTALLFLQFLGDKSNASLPPHIQRNLNDYQYFFSQHVLHKILEMENVETALRLSEKLFECCGSSPIVIDYDHDFTLEGLQKILTYKAEIKKMLKLDDISAAIDVIISMNLESNNPLLTENFKKLLKHYKLSFSSILLKEVFWQKPGERVQLSNKLLTGCDMGELMRFQQRGKGGSNAL